MPRSSRTLFGIAAALLIAAVTPTRAETLNVRIAQEYGISYLPLEIMREQHLLEKNAKKDGVDLTTSWLSLGAGPPMNEALISGNLDIASGGVAPMLVLWDRTRSNMKVHAISALESMPLYLNTTNVNVKTIKDFTPEDRIALPASHVSIQAIVLDMAAAEAWGDQNYGKLEPMTVSMSHPDGQAALLNGTAGITAHFTSAPYQYDELSRPNVHRVLNSYDVLGGQHTFNITWASQKFVDKNPKIIQEFRDALQEAENYIIQHPHEAAQLWVTAEKSSLPVNRVERIIESKENVWTTEPQRVLQFGQFMAKVGLIKQAPATDADIMFPGGPIKTTENR